MHASLRVRWNRSRFYGATDQQILQATFTYACGNATGGTQLTKLQAAAATLVPQEEGSSEVPTETLEAFREAVIDVMVEANAPKLLAVLAGAVIIVTPMHGCMTVCGSGPDTLGTDSVSVVGR